MKYFKDKNWKFTIPGLIAFITICAIIGILLGLYISFSLIKL